jgi:hypothetical protein
MKADGNVRLLFLERRLPARRVLTICRAGGRRSINCESTLYLSVSRGGRDPMIDQALITPVSTNS